MGRRAARAICEDRGSQGIRKGGFTSGDPPASDIMEVRAMD
ncbi:hypothetical protein SAMN05216332_102163 [Nitrosospira briensis]|nr:hypothetical protein SAMN05216332_102163 [Nitrosospira briensis]